MALSPYVAGLRAHVAHDLLLLPSVAVLPSDPSSRVLLVQNAETGEWQTLGGAIEPDESPRDAAVREALEEAGVIVTLGRLLDVVGGPTCRVRYPNGDEVSYVVAVYEALELSGNPEPDGEEISAVGWWSADQLAELPMAAITRAILCCAGLVPPPTEPPPAPPLPVEPHPSLPPPPAAGT